MKVCVVTTDSE
jgi:hypothetical protein